MKKSVVVVSLLLVVLVVSFIFFSGNNSGYKVYDLTDEFNINGNIVSAGIFNPENGGISGDVVKEFNDLYKEGLQKNEKVSLVYGDENEVHILGYEDFFKGEISMFTGKSIQRFKVNEETFTERKLVPETNKVKIVISGNAVEIDLKENENLYVVVALDERGKLNVRK